jgi:hypothetical protein
MTATAARNDDSTEEAVNADSDANEDVRSPGAGSAKEAPSFKNAVEIFVQLTGTSGVVVALLYYCGLERLDAYYAYFGVDAGSLNFGVTHFLTRSSNVIGTSAGVLAGVVIIGVGFFALLMWLLRAWGSVDPKARNAAMIVTTGLGVVIAAVLVTIMVQAGSSETLLLVLLGAILLMVEVAAFSWRTYRQLKGGVPLLSSKVVFVRRVAVGIGLIVVVLSLVTGYARRLGLESAEAVANDVGTLPEIVVYSEKEMKIEGVGLKGERIGTKDDAYAFRYENLRLLAHTTDRWVLLPERWQKKSGNVIVLADSSRVRVDFISTEP